MTTQTIQFKSNVWALSKSDSKFHYDTMENICIKVTYFESVIGIIFADKIYMNIIK